MTDTHDPWWASGRTAEEGLDGQDPLAAHRRGRQGGAAGNGSKERPADGPDDGHTHHAARGLVDDLAEIWTRLTTDAGRRRPEHDDGEVCQACPICLGLRAVRQARPEVIGHLADAAHAFSLALRALADSTEGGGGNDFQRIDLDAE